MLKQTLKPLFVLMGITALQAPALAETTERTTEAREFQFGEAYTPKDGDFIRNDTLASVTKATKSSKKRAAVNAVVNTDFWIYDAWTERFNDADYDGYATTVSVSFDADTVYAEVPVYAVLYLGDADSFYPVHESSVFYIYGESTSDEFVIETDLITGYRPFDYDIMIELFDAQTNELLAVADHTSDADLSYVPLESQDYDRVIVEQETVVEVREHGGALYWPFLAGLMGMGTWRKLSHRTRR
ncbi:MAG: choice-of-anchor H family protein [Pseudomonadota bacterium]|nr:choice-of-anchor H family protein [Pseudomonadota bacterium]